VLVTVAGLFAGAVGVVGAGLIRMDFFASDPIRLFYVNVEMPVGTPLERTLKKVLEVEAAVRAGLAPGEARAVVSYAGQMFTETAPRQGEHLGQILVSLAPAGPESRHVDAVVGALRAAVEGVPGPERVSFLRLSSGPPTLKPISIKVRGDDLSEIRAAAEALKGILASNPAIRDIQDDDEPGQMELVLRIDEDAARRAGVRALDLARIVRLLVDGEVVASMQHRGERVEVRVRALPAALATPDALLDLAVPGADGRPVPLRGLLDWETTPGLFNVRHYNFLRAVTVEADIDRTRTDTVQANAYVRAEWAKIRERFPGIDLDFSGELDDIQESLDAMLDLFLLGVGLMYAILGTQFRSYFQPLLILVTVPMAFTGVVAGLLVTGNPLSLFTLYGVVALAGIAVNSAIVLISAANARLRGGMSVLHATLYAGRRRVVPILITSLTTIAGLFSLATGLGGHSLVWGPVATAIVWGLVVSTVLTLFAVPLLYAAFMGRRPA
jgi:multidrug efflux pump subunit AcrB